MDFQEIFAANDRLNPKFVTHIKGLKRGTTKRLKHHPDYQDARDLIKTSGIHGIRPVLAILELDTYIAHGKKIRRLAPNWSGSPSSVEYQIGDIHGPKSVDPEIHLHCLY